MGNSACLLASGVAGITDAELNKTREEDEVSLSLLQQQLPQSEVGKFSGLDTYKVLGASTVPKTSFKPEAQEIGLLCLQDNPSKLADKFDDARTALQNEIKYLGAKEPSPERRYKNSRLQILCRIYDALLRQEERERRRVESSKATDKDKEKAVKETLPPIAKAGLGFGIGVLLKLVEAVGLDKPEVVSGTIDIAASVVSELKPLSLAVPEPALNRSIEAFTQFFEKVLSGSIPGIDKTTEFKAVTVTLGLALAKGDLTAALTLVQKFISVSQSPEWNEALPTLAPMLGNLRGLAAPGKGISWNWNPVRQGPDIVTSNENLTITRTNSSGWGNQKSEQNVTDGVYYVEFKIDRNSSSCLCIGVAASNILDFANKCSFNGVFCYQADGDTYINASSSGNIGGYTAGDKVGLLLNMEEHTIIFFKNGVKMNHDPFTAVPPDVQLIICFGGSDQFVTINNEGEVPAGFENVVVQGSKKADAEKPKAELTFPVQAGDIIEDASFNAFTKSEGTAQPSVAATFILASLDKLGDGTFGVFGLDELKPKHPKNRKVPRKNGLVVDVKPKTFHLLIEILQKLIHRINSRDWSEASFKETAWASLSALRLLRNNIFTSIYLSLPEAESGLTAEVKDQIKAVLKFFSQLSLEEIRAEATPENKEARDALDHQALLVTLHSFELFFPTLNSQLEFVINTLGSGTADEGEKRLANDVLKKITQPANLIKAFDTTTPESRERVWSFLSLLVNSVLSNTEKYLAGAEALDEDKAQNLFIAQSVLFSQIAKVNYEAESLALGRRYLEVTFAGAHKLLEQLTPQLTEGQLSTELEEKVKKTILDRHLITLLRSLSVLVFDSDFSAFLITEITKLVGVLNTFAGGKTEFTTGTTIVTENYESDHPYPNSADQTHPVKVPGALYYTLTFDNECKTETNYDYLQLYPNSTKSTELFKWTGERSQFPTAPLVVNQPELFFTFHSDGGTNYWGWKITIAATVEVTLTKEGWADELRNSVSTLLVALCKNLLAVEAPSATLKPAQTLLENKLLRGGVQDSALFRVLRAKPTLRQTLAELIANTQTEEKLPTKTSAAVGLLKLSVFKSLLPRRLGTKAALSSYLAKLGTADNVPTQYSDIPILDELIAGSERTVAAFEGLKAQAKVSGPLANLGGADFDQAERALFAVLLAFFELGNSFASLVDEPQEVGELFNFIVKQATQVRPWAQLQRQKLIETSNKEVTYAELGKDVVDKCVLLLSTDFKQTLSEIGIEKVLQGLVATIQRTQSVESKEKGALGATSKWKTVKKSVATLSRMKTLQGLRVLRRAQPQDANQDEDKKQFLTVYNLILEVFSSPATIPEIAEVHGGRRNKAVARSIGLNLMSMAFRAAPEASKGDLQGLISNAFSDGFILDSVKKHYSHGTEGIDPYLSSCLQHSFFQLYQLLLNRLKVSAVRDKDCTSETVTQYILSTLDALSFPFSDQDASNILDLSIRESAQFLLSWSKGQRFFEQLPTKFDRSKVIVDLKVHAESEYHTGPGLEAFSLNLKNRLAGEVAEDIEGQLKLALQVFRGAAQPDVQPITDVLLASPDTVIEGYTKIEGSINEVGEALNLFVKREEAKETGKYLTKVTVSGWCPINLDFTYESFLALKTSDVSAEEAKKRNDRKLALKRGSWLLFKLLLYSSAGQFEAQSSTTKQNRRGKLQELFTELLLNELRWLPRQTETEESLDLRRLLSGKNWRTTEVPLLELKTNPVGEWINKIREDTEEYKFQQAATGSVPGPYDQSILDVINEFITSTDPLLKGVLTPQEIPDWITEIPDSYRNSKGEVDFFLFLKHVVDNADHSYASPFWIHHIKTSKLLQNLPTNFYAAKQQLGEGSVASILSAFQSTIHPNDQDSFSSYLRWFSEAEVPGIIPKEKAPVTAPESFFNSEKQLDFFTTVQAIRDHPDQFPGYFQELKQLLQTYDILPQSSAAFYKAKLSPSQTEYQASLLLLLYQVSSSKSMLSVLAHQQTLVELTKHMLLGSLRASTIAFRIIREILAAEHSPESFEGLWASLPKEKLRAEYGAEAASNLVHMLLTFIGIKSSIHIKSWKFSLLSLEKIEVLSFEAFGFLQSLCKNERWREYVINTSLELVTRALTNIPAESGSESTIGAIGFLKSLDGRRDAFLHEWSHIELKGAGVSQGALIKHKKADAKLKIYCEGDDALHVESAEFFVSTVPESKVSLFNTLSGDVVNRLFKTLIELWGSIDNPEYVKTLTTPESRVNYFSIKRLVQSSALDILSALTDTKHELNLKDPSAFAQKLISNLSSESQPYFPPALYYQLRKILFTRHRSSVSSQVKSVQGKVAITEAEEAKIISTYNEEKQILVATLKSVGLDFADIKESLEHGSTDMDSVLKYIEQRNAAEQTKVVVAPTDTMLLYKLSKNDKNSPVFFDSTGKASYNESFKGHFSLTAPVPGKKSLLKKFEEGIFGSLEKAPEELTVLTAVGFSDSVQAAEFGVTIGKVNVTVSVIEETVGTATKNHFFRIFFRFDGHVTVINEATGETAFEGESGFNFEDIATTRYGLFLNTPGSVELKGFTVFLGHFKGSPTYWEEEVKEPLPVPGKFVTFKRERANATVNALVSALGVEYLTAVEIAEKHPDLKAALKSVFEERVPLTPLTTDIGHYVVDIAIVNSGEELPAGFEKTPIYFNRTQSSDYSGYAGKVVGVKFANERGLTFVKGLELKDEAISIVREEKGQGFGLVSVLILQVSDPQKVDIPAGYVVVGEGDKAFNLTPDSPAIHFLAYRTSFNFRNQPFTDLAQIPTKSSDAGMVDSFDVSSVTATNEFDSKRLGEEIATLNGQATVVLQTRLATLEKAYATEASFRLLLKLLRRWTDSVQDVASLSKLLESSGKKFALLKPAVSAVFAQPEFAPLIAEALLVDVITQLIKPIFAVSGASTIATKTLSFESSHPYENNLDKTGEIRIPGAKKLVFTFDPLCKSENNYDYLQFARDKDYQSEICKHTGSTWPNFEAEGDVVYYKFHSDGSNNDWGYKFTVAGSVAQSSEAVSSEDEIARALWILESLVYSNPTLPAYLARFQEKELQNALTLFAHTAPDSDLTLRALFLLKKALVTPVEVTPDSLAIVNLLSTETIGLYKFEGAKPEKSSLLKDAVALVLELKEKYDLTFEAEWFINFYETYSFLKGVDTKDENFQFLLLKQFLELKGRSLDVIRESAHPYAPVFASKEVYQRGASSIQVLFTKESEAELDHAVLFSRDLAGQQPILTTGGTAVSSNIQWSENPKGPNIAISNGGRSVTRTDSSGWGTALFNETFSTGKVKLTFKIDNDGGSGYLYIGVVQANPTSLSDCTYKDWSNNLWVYKVTGEFHRKGFSIEQSEAKYATGDEISLLLDFDERTVTFFKNGVQKYQLTELVGPVTGSACFGGSSQNVSLLSVESGSSDPSKISELKITIPGDKFYYHYPVNSGYINLFRTSWSTEKNPLIAFTNGNKTITRGSGSTDQSTILSTTVVKSGRQFLELKVVTLPAATVLSFGLALPDQASLAVAYQSDGVLKRFGESFMTESFAEGDSIALLLNVSQTELKVFKNGTQVSILPRVVLEEGKDFRWAVSINGQATAEILTNSAWTESLDLLGRQSPANATTKYGYKFSAKPVYIGKNKLIAFETLGNLQGEWDTYYKKQKHLFSKDVCEQLVNYIDEKSNTTDKDPLVLTAEDVTPTPEELLHYNLLEKLPLDDLRSVFKVIKDLNLQVNSALPLISLDLKEGSSSITELQKAFLHLRGYLFLKNKNKALKEFIARTNGSDRPTIEINRTRAIRQKERGLVDSQGVSSIFGQIYRLMNKASNRSLRNSERIYQVNFKGEGSIDAGGPYNEVQSNICEELMSKYLPLFVQSPNGVNNLGENRDGWVPNPSSESPLLLDMFLFLGKLFGVAIRTQNNLNLSLPPIFWRRLIFDEAGTSDVKGFDECIFQTLEILRHLDEQGITADNFSSAFEGETFTTRDSSGQVVELLPGGKDVLVTFQNAREYADLLEKQRLTEASYAYAALRKGMSGIVPMSLIYLFSWKQVETLVCGAPDINVDILKGNTIYEGLSDSSSSIQMFWEVFRELTSKERSLFLRFVWGRSRLPAGKEFKQFKITNKSVSGIVDNYLPVSHTCFFTLDLPPYTNKVTMKEKLVYAITHCQAIDLDRVAGAEGWEDE